MNRIFITLLLVVSSFSLMGQHVVINGFVTDSLNGETVIGASVYNKVSKQGTFTNSYGFYSIQVPVGKSVVTFSYVGYRSKTLELHLKSDTTINIQMDVNTLKEVVVQARRDETGVQGVHMSAVTIDVDKIKSLPVIMGETDVIKTLQLLPGVKGGTEGSSGMYVRGGGPDQNLFLLDGTPLYNVNHMLGFFSAFDANAIKNVTLYKGDFPARFGGRLSSVVDVYLKDGDNSKIHGEGSIGLISSKLFLEGPLFNKNTTFAVSGRRTYLDILTKPLIAMARKTEPNLPDVGCYFYDLSAKVSHKFSDKDKLFFSGYMGDDVIYFSMPIESSFNSKTFFNTNFYGKNAVSAVRWSHIVNSKLFVNTSVAYTGYRSDVRVSYKSETNGSYAFMPLSIGYDNLNKALTMKTRIEDWSIKFNLDYTPNSKNRVKIGTNLLYHSFVPTINTTISLGSMAIDTTIGGRTIIAKELNSYIEDTYTFNDRWSANGGVHYSLFNVQGETYHSLQPRASIRYLLSDNFSVKAAYSNMSQNIHLLSNSRVGLPTEIWVPSTKRIPPTISNQYAAGLFYNLKNLYDISIEGYYKTMDNLLEYKDGSSYFDVANTSWEDKVVMGKGWSYGAELLVKKDIGATTGWIGYTWAKSERLFNRPGQELSFGNVFPDKFDIRHSASIVISHKFSNKFDVGAVWVYSSGKAGTLALQKYQIEQPEKTSEIDYVGMRNNYRYPDYHHLDLSFNWHKKIKWGERTFSIQLYNVYNQKNADFVLDVLDDNDNKAFKKITIFPFIPSFSYTIKF